MDRIDHRTLTDAEETVHDDVCETWHPTDGNVREYALNVAVLYGVTVGDEFLTWLSAHVGEPLLDGAVPAREAQVPEERAR